MRNMSRGLISALGALIAVVLVAAGVFLVALPIYLSATGVHGQADAAAATNDQLQVRVDALAAQAKDTTQLTQAVAQLRAQIPSAAGVDQLVDLVTTAASAAGVTITSITPSPAVAFAPRTSEVAAADAANTATAGSAGSSATTPATGTTAAPVGRLQVPIAITVTAKDAAQAASFLDALRAGPRLLAIVGTSATETGTGSSTGGALTVTVSALAFAETEQ